MVTSEAEDKSTDQLRMAMVRGDWTCVRWTIHKDKDDWLPPPPLSGSDQQKKKHLYLRTKRCLCFCCCCCEEVRLNDTAGDTYGMVSESLRMTCVASEARVPNTAKTVASCGAPSSSHCSATDGNYLSMHLKLQHFVRAMACALEFFDHGKPS